MKTPQQYPAAEVERMMLQDVLLKAMAGFFKQRFENAKGLVLELHPHAALAQLARAEVHLEDAEAQCPVRTTVAHFVCRRYF